MQYSIYDLKKYHRVLIIFFLGIVFLIFMAPARFRSNLSPASTENVSLPKVCNLSYHRSALKPIFKYAYDKISMKSSSPFIHPEMHICDQLYSNDTEFDLFSRVYAEFQPFSKHKISFNDIEIMSNSCIQCHHIQIIQKKLYNVPRPGAHNYETRSRSVKMLIKNVIDTFFPDIPDLDLFFNVDDRVDIHERFKNVTFNVPIFALTKTKKIKSGFPADGLVLMPCFSLWSWPEVNAGRWSNKIESLLTAANKTEFEKRIPKFFWRGIDSPRRSWVITAAKKYTNMMDVASMSWDAPKGTMSLTGSSAHATQEQHCDYKYLLHLEGATYSSRIKYLLLCGSTVIYNAIEYWEEYWYHLWKNGTNIIIFEGHDNEQAINNIFDFLKNNEDKAKEIGRQGQKLVQDYLNEHAVSCYWWKLLQEYAKLLEYKPSLHPNAVHIDDFMLGGAP